VTSSLPDQELLASFEVWLRVEKGRRPATIEAYLRDLEGLQRWLLESASSFRTCTSQDLDRYVSSLRKSNRKESTIARATSSIRGFYRYVSSEKLVATDPTTMVRPPRRATTLPKPIPEEQMFKLLDSIPLETAVDLRDAALLELLYCTGCRVSEVVGVRLGDLDFSESLLKVTGKGAKQRLVPIGNSLLKALERYLGKAGRSVILQGGTSDRLFLNSRGGALSRQGIDIIIRSRALLAGVPSAHLSAHVFRHSCATHMLEHGADIRVVQELLGHASISTTQAYTAVTANSLRREYLQAHPRAKG
jgi:integrase/recombinase XerD